MGFVPASGDIEETPEQQRVAVQPYAGPGPRPADLSDGTTENLNLILPAVNDPAGQNEWGDKLNWNFAQIDLLLPQDFLTDAPADGQLYARQDLAWTAFDLDVAWADIPDKPATFPPTLPIQTSDVAGLDAKQSAQDGQIAANTTAIANVYDKGTSDARYVDIAGDTMSGDLTITKATPILTLNKSAGVNNNIIYGTRANLKRWGLNLGNQSNEAGSNAGSDFNIARYDDAGNPIDTPILVNRATGVVAFTQTPLVAGAPLIGGVTISDTPPVAPVPGQLWLESDSGALFARWDDGSGSPSVQWVQVNAAATGGLSQATADTLYVNTTGDTMSGNLTVPNLTSTGGVTVGSGGIVNSGNLLIQKGAPYILIDNTDGGAQSSGIQWQRGGLNNWLMMEGATGANNDWMLQRYNAGGTFQESPIRIAFATGNITLSTPTTSSVTGAAAVALMGLSANGHGVYGNTSSSSYCGIIGYNFDNSAIARLGYNTYAAYLTGPAAITAGTLNITNTTTTDHIRLVNGANSQSFGYSGGMGNYNVSPSTMRHTLHYAGTAGYNFDQGYFFCTPSGGMTLGTGTYRWGQIYSTVGTISTSDERIKQDIRPLDEAEKRVAQALKGLIVAYRYKEAVTAKGDEARIHVGVIAQRVAEAFEAEGLDAARYGLWCADDQYTEEYIEDVPTDVEEIDEETGEARTVSKMAGRYEKTLTGEVIYSIRYEELLAFIIGGL